MTRYLGKWLATSLAVFLVPKIVSGIYIENFATALAVAAVLGLLNVLLRPVILFLTMPLTVLTLGLSVLCLNAFLFRLAGSFVEGFKVDSFGAAFWASLLISVMSWFVNADWRVTRVNHRIHARIRDLNERPH